jgi:hypothetical protein
VSEHLEQLSKSQTPFSDTKVQETVSSILSFYSGDHTNETLERLYAGLRSAHDIVSTHEVPLNTQLSIRKNLEKRFQTWTKSLPVYQQMYLFVEGLAFSLLGEAKQMGVNITPEQEEKLLTSFRLKFGDYYPFSTEADLKVVKKKK